MLRKPARLIIVVVLETGALAWLLFLGHRPWLRIDWSDFGKWIRATPAEDAIAAMIWLAALGCMMWLAGSTVLYLIALAGKVRLLIRSVQWMTLPVIRRVTEKALGTMLVASTMAAVPVRADPPPPIVVAVNEDDTLVPPGLAGQVGTLPHGPAVLAEPAAPPLQPSEGRLGVDAVVPAEVTVRSGDNLWIMCRRYLTGALGHRPTNGEVAPYWRQVIANNRPHLISGNPDLIFAGEVIEMPPIS